MDSVRSGPFGQIFRPDNFIFGQVSPLGRGYLPTKAPCLVAGSVCGRWPAR